MNLKNEIDEIVENTFENYEKLVIKHGKKFVHFGNFKQKCCEDIMESVNKYLMEKK